MLHRTWEILDMAGQGAPSPSRKRVHIVLIPGFAGFDALGQLEYYSAVTPLFQARLARNEVLHYFDNLPTAAVVTRAARLQKYLARRMARGEILPRDEVILVGHSTGGLDIRWLLRELHRRKGPVVVDGGAEVEPRQILKCVRRVVFLSVPHWGTNIADWVRSHKPWREAVIAELRAAVAGSQVPLVDKIEDWIAGGAACLTGAGLLRAVQDSLMEADERIGEPSPTRMADAQEAASQLELYLRHMASNFRAIDDLTCSRPDGGPLSPAHFNDEERKQELALWDDRHIESRSYVTLGKRPFEFDRGRPAPLWELTKPWTYPEIAKDARLSARTDIVYRACYRACAGGPFEFPTHSGKVTRWLGAPPRHVIERWDNDGIVNTASMLWPRGEKVLVPGDHMDIVGQYQPIKAAPGEGRRFQAYDLLKSDSGFGDKIFKEVWNEIFDFSVGRQ
jgi:triacylglycerol lipase